MISPRSARCVAAIHSGVMLRTLFILCLAAFAIAQDEASDETFTSGQELDQLSPEKMEGLGASGLDSLTKDELELLDESGYNALHRAAAHGAAAIVSTIIAKGVDINVRSLGDQEDDPRATALALASGKGHTDVVKLLLDAHADPDEIGETSPLILAASSGELAVVKLLLDAGATLDAPGVLAERSGVTALNAAAMTGQAEAVELLLEAGANPSSVDSRGASVLQAATAYAQQTAATPALRETIEEAGGGQYKAVLTSLRKALARKAKAEKKAMKQEV